MLFSQHIVPFQIDYAQTQCGHGVVGTRVSYIQEQMQLHLRILIFKGIYTNPGITSFNYSKDMSIDVNLMYIMSIN